jgi:hypothetical protein
MIEQSEASITELEPEVSMDDFPLSKKGEK